MIEFLQNQIAGSMSDENKINRLRETLQLLCLKILYDKDFLSKIAFVGGTALRVLYDMRRFSEDLDFSVINRKGYDFTELISSLRREFKLYGLEMKVKTKTFNTVQSSMLKFPALLNAMGLSAFENQNLSIKIEVDSNPPSGWQIETTVINKIYVLNLTHFDLPSLFATKLHACFFRRYVKGRDFYDLMWYIGKKIKPNYDLFNNAIEQTQGVSLNLGDKNIKDFILEKVSKIDFKTVREDVERFLEDKSELKLLEQSVVSKSIADVFG